MSYAGGTIIKSHMLITLGLCPMAADLAFTPDLAELWMSCKIQSEGDCRALYNVERCIAVWCRALYSALQRCISSTALEPTRAMRLRCIALYSSFLLQSSL